MLYTVYSVAYSVYVRDAARLCIRCVCLRVCVCVCVPLPGAQVVSCVVRAGEEGAHSGSETLGNK
jgi:hypothetical protein